MRRIWILMTLVVLGAFTPMAVGAQEPIKATTFDGKRVLLYPDGRWQPATTDPGPAAHLGAFAPPQEVTLYSRRKYDDYMKATFSFKHGIRDDPGLKLTRNQWDLLFDNGDGGFSVGMTQEDRSRIVDLGEMAWAGLRAVPVVTALQVSSAPLRDTTKQHAMVCSFITSDEYQNRFSALVTHTNAQCPQ